MIDFKITKDETVRTVHIEYDNSKQENRTKMTNAIINDFNEYKVKIIQSGANLDKLMAHLKD